MRLQPYSNQVTGHDCLLTTEDNSTICKVRNENELNFYKKMDKTLQPFTPEFKGVVEVTIQSDDKGKFIFEAHFDEDLCKSCVSRITSRKYKRKNKKFMKSTAGPVKYRGWDCRLLTDSPEFHKNNYTRDSKGDAGGTFCDIGQNPWVNRVRKIGRHVAYSGNTIPYIVLENISGSFEKPCILDVKPGTQIHGDDCLGEKLARHSEKNDITTTSTLGLRLSGLQVYRDGSFLCRDKFYGRGLSAEGFRNCIKLFFTGERKLRTRLIEKAMDKVAQMKTVISSLNGLRYHGSSLVVFYEGATENGLLDVRLVDFAHSSICREATPDKGFIFGLTNFYKMLEDIAMKAKAG